MVADVWAAQGACACAEMMGVSLSHSKESCQLTRSMASATPWTTQS